MYEHFVWNEIAGRCSVNALMKEIGYAICTLGVIFSFAPSLWMTCVWNTSVLCLISKLYIRIFENSGEEDCLRLLVGRLPKSKTGPAHQSLPSSLPLSRHYAQVLADLALQRGFDGYLLNFECPLRGGVEQTRALAAWITILQSEILAKVGSHGETIWFELFAFIFNVAELPSLGTTVW
jgi:hypothetical protein